MSEQVKADRIRSGPVYAGSLPQKQGFVRAEPGEWQQATFQMSHGQAQGALGLKTHSLRCGPTCCAGRRNRLRALSSLSEPWGEVPAGPPEDAETFR